MKPIVSYYSVNEIRWEKRSGVCLCLHLAFKDCITKLIKIVSPSCNFERTFIKKFSPGNRDEKFEILAQAEIPPYNNPLREAPSINPISCGVFDSDRSPGGGGGAFRPALPKL